MEQIQDPIWQQGYQAYEDGKEAKDNPYAMFWDDPYSQWANGYIAARNYYHHNMDILRGWCDQEEPIDNK